jgi:TM2 domain-containing membrane protein YozV
MIKVNNFRRTLPLFLICCSIVFFLFSYGENLFQFMTMTTKERKQLLLDHWSKNNNNNMGKTNSYIRSNIENNIHADEEWTDKEVMNSFSLLQSSNSSSNDTNNNNSTSSIEYCPPPYNDIPRRSQKRAMFLTIFLGFLGADRFYLGYHLSGAIKLLTLGGFGAWWVLDAITIISGAMVDINGCALIHNCCWPKGLR